jgi:hypothetical protein
MCYLGHANGVKDDLNPVENLRFADGLQGRAFDQPRAIATLERLGLSRCLDLPCRVLSFGQRRRVALAALLLAGATLWILDEPLTGTGCARGGADGRLDPRSPDRRRHGGRHDPPGAESGRRPVQRLLVGNVAIPELV